MPDEHLQLAYGWGGSLGQYRITHEGQVPVSRNVVSKIEVPVDERNWKEEVGGARMAEASVRWHGTDEEFAFLSMQSNKDKVPLGRWTRPAKTGGAAPGFSISRVCMYRVASVNSSQDPDTVTVKEFELAPAGIFHSGGPGILFDWEVSAATGVSAATVGAWVNTGALAAGESFDVWALNLHHPAPTASSVAWSIQSRTKGITLDAGPAVDKGGGLVGLPSTAHGYSSGNLIEIVGTTNYDAEHTLDATTSANELVVPATFVSETFAGTEEANLVTLVANLAAATTTPSWQQLIIDGASAAQWLRVNIALPADNEFYPVVLVTSRKTAEV